MVCKWWQSGKQVASEHCEFRHNWHMVTEELAVDWVNDEQTFELKSIIEIHIMSMVVVTDLYVLSKFTCCCRESLSSCTDMFLSI